MARVLTDGRLNVATLIAAAAGLSAGAGFTGFRLPSIKRVRNYPQPQCSTPEEIAEWNANVNTRQVRRRHYKKFGYAS